eukprot:Opistho-1_new@65947
MAARSVAVAVLAAAVVALMTSAAEAGGDTYNLAAKVDIQCLTSHSLDGGSIFQPDGPSPSTVTCNKINDGDVTFLTCAARYVMDANAGKGMLFGYDFGTTIDGARKIIVSSKVSGDMGAGLVDNDLTSVTTPAVSMAGPSDGDGDSGAPRAQQGTAAVDGMICKVMVQVLYLKPIDPCASASALVKDNGGAIRFSTCVLNGTNQVSFPNPNAIHIEPGCLITSGGMTNYYVVMDAASFTNNACQCADGSTELRGADNGGALFVSCPTHDQNTHLGAFSKKMG